MVTEVTNRELVSVLRRILAESEELLLRKNEFIAALVAAKTSEPAQSRYLESVIRAVQSTDIAEELLAARSESPDYRRALLPKLAERLAAEASLQTARAELIVASLSAAINFLDDDTEPQAVTEEEIAPAAASSVLDSAVEPAIVDTAEPVAAGDTTPSLVAEPATERAAETLAPAIVPEQQLEVPAVATEPPHYSDEQTVSYRAVNYRHTGRVTRKTPYCLWALFLGGFGAHKFYSGQKKRGFLYLIFCWTYIPSIIAMAELIIAACKTTDSEGYICLDGGVNKKAYIIIAVLGGWFGAHKFYAGRYGWGIVYAVFSATGVPCIVSLVEAFLALRKSSDANGDIIW